MPVQLPNQAEKDLRKYQATLDHLARGRSNAFGDVTLAVGLTSTTVQDPTIVGGGAAYLMPMTAAASTVAWHIPDATYENGQFVVQHPAAAADCTFRWVQVAG